jgi:hypothetical protein
MLAQFSSLKTSTGLKFPHKTKLVMNSCRKTTNYSCPAQWTEEPPLSVALSNTPVSKQSK